MSYSHQEYNARSTQVAQPFGGSIQEYRVLELLGKGGFAHVYRGQCRRTDTFVAIKMIDKTLMTNAGMVGRVRQEVSIHSRLKHPSILGLYTFFEDTHYVYLILELAHNGELARYFRLDASGLTEENAANIFRQVVDGVLYLHSHKIIHRDLSLNNLLLTKDLQVKIADFGLATQLNEPNEKHMTMCGTPNYISPEVASKSNHGLPADVWGLGCLLYTLLVGKPPFDTQHVKQTLSRVIKADYQIPAGFSNEACDLLDRLLRKNPAERISLTEIIRHPFLTKMFRVSDSQTDYNKDSGLHTTLHTTQSAHYRSRSEDRLPSASYETPYRPRANSTQRSPNMKKRPSSFNVLSGIRSNNTFSPQVVAHPKSDSSNISGSFQFKSDKLKNEHDSGICGYKTEQDSYKHSGLNDMNPNMSDQIKRQDNKENALTTRTIGVPPLCTARLNKMNYRSRIAEFSISEDGSVRIHIIKKFGRAREERITEVYIISKDGMQIINYPVNGNSGCPLTTPLPTYTPSSQNTFSYHNLPQKHWKQYVRAATFVNLIRAKTQKITLYTKDLKCHLMENGTDFEGLFYNGMKIKITASDGMKITDKDGNTFRNIESCGSDIKDAYDHFQNCMKRCLAVESAASEWPDDSFPITLGRRPDMSQSTTPMSQSSQNNTPNIGFGSSMNIDSFRMVTESASSRADYRDKRKGNEGSSFIAGSQKSFNPSGERNYPFKSNSVNSLQSHRGHR